MSDRGFGEQLADTGMAVVAVAFIAAAVATAIFCWLMISELARIYASRAFDGSRTARALWIALGALLGLWVVAGILLAIDPRTLPIGLGLSSWGWLAYVIVVIALDRHERETEQPRVVPAIEEPTLRHALGPWQFGAAPSEDGARPAARGNGGR